MSGRRYKKKRRKKKKNRKRETRRTRAHRSAELVITPFEMPLSTKLNDRTIRSGQPLFRGNWPERMSADAWDGKNNQ
jgi:hypothetical protein